MTASWPTSTVGYGVADFDRTASLASSTLSAGITGSPATFGVADATTVTTWPTANFCVKVDNELIYVSSRSGNTLTVGARGHDGTAQADHLIAVVVKVVMSSKHIIRQDEEIIALETYAANTQLDASWLAGKGIFLTGTGNTNTILDLVKFTASGVYERPWMSHYGAISVEDGAMTATGTTLTSATAVFVVGDVGKAIVVAGAGAAGVPLATTIAGYTNSTTISLTASASTTVTNAVVTWNRATLMAAIGYHAVNSSDNAAHRALELKTTEATNTGYKTRFGATSGTDESVITMDAVRAVIITNSLGGVSGSVGAGVENLMRFQVSDSGSTRSAPTARTLFELNPKWGDRVSFNTILDLNPYAYGQSGNLAVAGTEAVTVRWFRSTNTSGARAVEFHKGDGTNTPTVKFNTATGNIQWLGGAGSTFLASLQHNNAAARTYTFPDLTGTVGVLGATQTWSGTNTYSANVTVQKASPVLILNDSVSANTGIVNITNSQIGTGIGLLFDILPTSGAADAQFRLFRSTNTSGQRTFSVFKGDGTSTQTWNLDASTGDTTQAGGIGFNSSTAFRVNFTHAATANRAVTFPDASGTVRLTSDTVTTQTVTYTALAADDVIFMDATAGAITLNLPTAVGISGKSYWAKKVDASANAVTIDANGTQTIDGSLTYVLPAQYNSVRLTSNGSNWTVF